jgi:DNA-binding protein HU-beta
MTKQDLIDHMAQEANITKTQAKKSLDALIGGVTKSLKQKQAVTLVGFGTFTTATRAARKGRNPRTNAVINIPATTVPKFRPGKALKQSVK